jgi:hypothetical protein
MLFIKLIFGQHSTSHHHFQVGYLAVWEAHSATNRQQSGYKACGGAAKELHNVKATNGCSMLCGNVGYLPVEGTHCSAAIF